jgi:hypothetical protein
MPDGVFVANKSCGIVFLKSTSAIFRITTIAKLLLKFLWFILELGEWLR